MRDGLPILDVPYLIYFKAKAHIDINSDDGKCINRKDKNKHFKDICQLSLLVTDEMIRKVSNRNIPGSVENDMKKFIVMFEKIDNTRFKQTFKQIPYDVRPEKEEVLNVLQSLIQKKLS